MNKMICTWMVSVTVVAAACAQDARQILETTGVKGGLVVHLGCGDGKLTAALHANDSFLVQGLDTDAKNVAVARRYIQSLDFYGQVSVEQWDGKRLPYVDNCVNLVVASGACGVARDEMLRVLAPNGVALIGGEKIVKPRPKEIDEWTHFLHGADNNAVAQDTVINMPQHIQWVGDPNHSRSHQFLSSISAMVSADGRLFYIADEGPTWLYDFAPAKWTLAARDAFNGVTLWKRPITSWQPASQSGRIPFPPDLFRRLVAVGNRVYVTMSIFGPVEALDAASGATLRTYTGTEKTEEIICDGGVLFCVAAVADPGHIDRRAATYERTQPTQKRILAVRAETGEVLWSKEDAATLGYQPLTLIAQGKRTLFQNPNAIFCLDAATGKQLWRHEQKSEFARVAYSTPTLLIADDVVLCADRAPDARRKSASAQLVALSADTGKELWHCDCVEGHSSSPEVFVVNGLVWTGESPGHKDLDFRTARDLHTGAVIKHFADVAGWPTWHHHRCYREKATTQFLLTSRTGVEFTDLASGALTPHNWMRGVCRYGVLPCNGLIYLPPDQCACYIESKLHGFNAVAPARKTDMEREASSLEQLERGPAFEEISNLKAELSDSDWPTYRHDAARSSRTSVTIKPERKLAWSTQLGGKLSSLVSAGGKLFIAQTENHAVLCLDAGSGKVLWRFTAGGRVDSPPTIAKGLAVFGSQDGCVYALRASDGALVWRFHAVPDDQRLVAHNQLESVWPVHGSTLVEDDAVFVAAGRNSYFDGGVTLCKLELATGKVLSEKCFSSRDPKTGLRENLFKPFEGKVLPDREMPGLLPDVFSGDRNSLYLRSVALTRDFELIGKGQPHLFSSMGFVDDDSWERTYWLFGTHMFGGARGWPVARTLEPGGRMMAFDDTKVFGFDDATSKLGAGLFAAAKAPKLAGTPDVSRKAKKAAKQHDKTAKHADKSKSATAGDDDADGGKLGANFAFDWRKKIPVNVRAMVLSGDTLFVAGPERFDEDAVAAQLRTCRTDDAKLTPLLADAMASIEGRKGASLWAVNKADGAKLAACKLDSAPVFDGMIAANERLYLATLDGRVVCLAAGE